MGFTNPKWSRTSQLEQWIGCKCQGTSSASPALVRALLWEARASLLVLLKPTKRSSLPSFLFPCAIICSCVSHTQTHTDSHTDRGTETDSHIQTYTQTYRHTHTHGNTHTRTISLLSLQHHPQALFEKHLADHAARKVRGICVRFLWRRSKHLGDVLRMKTTHQTA